MTGLFHELGQHIIADIPEDQVIVLLQRYRQYTEDLVLISRKPFSDICPTSTGYGGCCGCDEEDDCTIGSDCTCVANTGNFYDSQGYLLLEALPPNWPLVECGDACRCETSCSLRVTQRGPSKHLVLGLSQFGGLGIFTSQGLLPGTFISLYAGEFIDHAEAQRRFSLQQSNNEGNYVLSMRENDQVIGYVDPTYIGNIGRFLNHSCEPNCVLEYVRWGANAVPRPAIFSRGYIVRGEELTWNYSGNAAPAPTSPKEAVTEQKVAATKCLCGSTKCSGFLPYDATL